MLAESSMTTLTLAQREELELIARGWAAMNEVKFTDLADECGRILMDLAEAEQYRGAKPRRGGAMTTQCSKALAAERKGMADDAVRLHLECTGAYRAPRTRIERCRCPCHEGMDALAISRVPITAKPVVDFPRTPGKCECCGQDCSETRRITRDHASKFETELRRQARQGSGDAAMEIAARGWSLRGVPEPVMTQVDAAYALGTEYVADQMRQIIEVRQLRGGL